MSSDKIQATDKAARYPAWLERSARKAVFGRLARIVNGRLTIEDETGRRSFGAVSDACPLDATITVDAPRFYVDTMLGGNVGAAESYITGAWHASDLTTVMRIMVRNRHVLQRMHGITSLPQDAARIAAYWLARNTRRGSRRNIVAHYDLGNEFFTLFLDKTMMYSSAIFERDDMTLEEASQAKLDRICRKLCLGPDDHVVEIGTGWGGFALHAAQNYGCRVTTTTISDAQFALARERVRDAGLGDRIEVLREDYRDLKGSYDKAVSIEMVEAVGRRFYPAYFGALGRLLKPNGMALIQAIIIDDRLFWRAAHSVDFIKRFIFPGSCIPSITALVNAATSGSDLRLFHLEDITPHYARTLREWRGRFFAHIAAVRAQGYSEAFIRMWEYYLCYCEGGFLERQIGDVQMIFAKPLCRAAPILPPLDTC